MLSALVFEFPLGFLAIIPLAGALAYAGWRQKIAGLGAGRILKLVGLRAVAALPLLLLVARPVWLARESPAAASRPVVVLVDRSESMSLEEQESSRYRQALGLLRTRLLPALNSAQLPVQAMLFDESAETADGQQLERTVPKGKRTNLGGAIAQALTATAQPPLALVALTDGLANQNAENTRALRGLAESQIPFIGVGFGSDQGVRTLSLRDVEAPPSVPSKTSFSISAQLEMINTEDLQPFDLLLYRDGQVFQKKSIAPGRNSRSWLENFQLTESEEGTHNYTVQMLPPNQPNLKCVNLSAQASVRVSDEKELRVLYIQGALTWDYKFINLALHNDPTIKLTGLTRTSKQSVFRQNIESAGELMNGFPTTLEELAPFRVVVLSNLRPADLAPAQQEILARFCGELGGGLLMVGGASTFDNSWQNSRLEQLLPVVFSAAPGVQGLDRPFRIQLTDEALQQRLFQVAEKGSPAEAWSRLPVFSQYGRVDDAKAGAQVWMLHQTDLGPHGRRILMASQRYGAGLSAVLTVQNFWRWRLARDSEPQEFDRFWRQLFRYLSEVGRQDVAIHLGDQELHPDMDVRVVVEKQPNPKNLNDTAHKFFIRVEDSKKKVLEEDAVELEPMHPVDFKFHAGSAGMYTIVVADSLKVPVSTRPVEIRDVNVEFQNTARDMETLRQWASVSDGLAFKAEECPAAADLVARIKAKVEEVRRGKQMRRPVGLNAWLLSAVLASLCGEWLLRKRWELL